MSSHHDMAANIKKSRTPTNTRPYEQKRHQKQKKKPSQQEEGKPTTPNKTGGSEAGRTNQQEEGRGGKEDKRRPADFFRPTPSWPPPGCLTCFIAFQTQ